MSTLGFIFILLIVVFVLPVIYGIVQYNGLVTLRNAYKNAFAQIDVQLQRRFDLIPNLVETVNKYMKHEKETLTAVIDARNQAQKALNQAKSDGEHTSGETMKVLSSSQGQLDGALSRLMMLVESYPDLKANQNMMQLTEELSTTENKVAFARQFYNDSVMTYNNKVESFPSNIIAGVFNFIKASMLTLPREQEKQIREAVKVSFD